MVTQRSPLAIQARTWKLRALSPKPMKRASTGGVATAPTGAGAVVATGGAAVVVAGAAVTAQGATAAANGITILANAAKAGGAPFSPEKQALVDMAQGDKKTGMSPEDMQAYKDLNKELPDPFTPRQLHGPETHPLRTPESTPGPGQEPHGHVGKVGHIPIKESK
jgi:hypothetical protein